MAPSKRPAGLLKSSKSSKKVCLKDESTASINKPATQPPTVMVGELDDALPDNLSTEIQIMLNGALARLARGHEELGRTLLRGVLHECTRALALFDLSNDTKQSSDNQIPADNVQTAKSVEADADTDQAATADKLQPEEQPTILCAYAQALCVLAAHMGDIDQGTPSEYMELAKSQLKTASTAASLDDSRSSTLLVQTESLLSVTTVCLTHACSASDDSFELQDTKLETLSNDMLEILGTVALRQLGVTDHVEQCASLAKRLWSAVSDATEAEPNVFTARKVSKNLGLAQALIAIAGTVVDEQGDNDDTVDRESLENARNDLSSALLHLQVAFDGTDTPNEQLYLPRAEAFVNLATVGEMLDDSATTIVEHFTHAIENFKLAQKLDPDAVSDDMIQDLESSVEAILEDNKES